MTIKDILLHLDSYPEPTPDALVEQAIWWARYLRADVTALNVDIQIPVHSNRIADYLIGLTEMARGEEERSRAQGRAVLSLAADRALAANVALTPQTVRGGLYDLADLVVRAGRTHDLTIVPLTGKYDDQQSVARAVVFGSGRPSLILGQSAVDEAATGCGHAVIAWDGGACAARALGDALPLLTQAARVTVVIVADDKPSVGSDLSGDIVRHMRAHGVEPSVRTLSRQGRSAGAVIEAYVREAGADLLVMGAYGHSRAREFVLGGATEHILGAPPCAVLMAHA
ncbi:universal stress protein [Caulobacter sp. 1776]|uniref:universal stress protein n=1 Tax=Caulobacter sp. 1776 TaxID=3156420 RepID=UPI003399440C